MRLPDPRIPPVGDGELDGEPAELLRKSTLDGHTLNITRTLLRHPKLYKRWSVFGQHVLFKSTLPARDRELLILRTGWHWRAGYEWTHHVDIAKEIGIGDQEIARIADGPDAPGWSDFDRTLLQAADELCCNAFVTDRTWSKLASVYEVRQLLDLVFTVGQYTLVAMAVNTLGVQLEDDAPQTEFPLT